MNLKCPNAVFSPDLLGVDVGFSKIQKSTGIAILNQDRLSLYRADSTWADRQAGLPKDGFCPSVIAIDGPLLPEGAAMKAVRYCEQFFSRGLFCRRCKPGLSHFGTGYLLREAAHEARRQFSAPFSGPRVVEAFPNLFLGVMVREDQYAQIPKLRRGQKFDWLYGCAKQKLARLREFIVLPDAVYDRVEIEDDHELRAALVCLLTAALEGDQKAIRVGEPEGGWFWLPPLELWEPWAIEQVRQSLGEEAVETVKAVVRNGAHEGTCTPKAS